MLQQIKELEHRGFQFEAAEGSFEMLGAPRGRGLSGAVRAGGLHGAGGEAGQRWRARAGDSQAQGGGGDRAHGSRAGPVNALDRAVRKALLPHYPELAEVHLVDYRVRIVDEHLGTGARPRVIVESARGAERWSTVGCSENIIEASWLALCDALELGLLRHRL